MTRPITTIVSGGQTGADRAALDFARASGIATRGWVPKGRRDELGRISDAYAGLVETDTEDPQVRTILNVRDSDGTVVLCHGEPTGGTRLAAETARDLRRLLLLDLNRLDVEKAAATLGSWVAENRIESLNVAGPRQSEDGRIYAETSAVLRRAFPPPA